MISISTRRPGFCLSRSLAADVGERGPGVGMACEILQVDDVAAAFAGGGERRDAERMHGDVGIEAEGGDVAVDQLFDRSGGHRPDTKTRGSGLRPCQFRNFGRSCVSSSLTPKRAAGFRFQNGQDVTGLAEVVHLFLLGRA